MLRPATLADIPRLLEIRDNAGDNALSDPQAVDVAAAAQLIDNGAMLVWQEADGMVAGFVAADERDGSIRVLLVAPEQEGRGIGRALLQVACDRLRAAGHRAAMLAINPGSPAERHYRAAGWSAAAISKPGRLILQKPL